MVRDMRKKAGLWAATVVVAAMMVVAGVQTAPAKPIVRHPTIFATKCAYVYSDQVDPIVAPGIKPSAHLHDFFGNTSTNENSTYAQMESSPGTCGLVGDTAGYWTPSLLMNGVQVKPLWMEAYYYLGSKSMDPTTEHTIPAGLEMLAGGVTANGSTMAFWKCERGGSPRTELPTNCGSSWVHANVVFPSCWDGANLDTVVPDPANPGQMIAATNPLTGLTYPNDHRSHMAYPDAAGACPADHPVPIARVGINVRYPIHNGKGDTLSSGDATTLHADFWNTWQQPVLDNLVVTCLQANIDCGILSG
jgi:Domain of unknown function (DUF1996)